MEQTKDYIESQTDIIARMLKKILEKLLKLKAAEDDTQSILQESTTYDESLILTIEGVLQINNQQLVVTLTNQYGYNAENLKLLADTLYEMKGDNETSFNCRKKALILYQYFLKTPSSNLDYTVYSRINYLEGSIV